MKTAFLAVLFWHQRFIFIYEGNLMRFAWMVALRRSSSEC